MSYKAFVLQLARLIKKSNNSIPHVLSYFVRAKSDFLFIRVTKHSFFGLSISLVILIEFVLICTFEYHSQVMAMKKRRVL